MEIENKSNWKIYLYNFTMDWQECHVPGFDVEAIPRLLPISEVDDWYEMYNVVNLAFAEVEKESSLLVCCLGQLQSIIQQFAEYLDCDIYFPVFDHGNIESFTKMPRLGVSNEYDFNVF